MTKAQILFACSEEFKDALVAYAQKRDLSVALIIRRVLAKEIGYDLAAEKIVDGRRKYESIEARKKEQFKRQKEERQELAKLIAAFGQEQRRNDVSIIEASLLKKGVSVD